MSAHVGYALLEDPWDVPVDQDLELDFRFWAGRGKATAAAVTSATAYFRQPGASVNDLEVIAGAGITITGGVVSLRVPAATMATLVPGTTYDFQLSVVANGSPRQVRVSVRAMQGLG